MAHGDVTVELVEDFTTTTVDTAVTGLYVSGSDTWLMTSVHNGQDILIVHIERSA